MPPSLAHCAISSRLADEIMLADRLHWFGTVAALLATESSDLRQNDEKQHLGEKEAGMTTNRPLIAVTPLMDYGRDSLWMLPGYMEAIMRAGGTPVMLPLTDDTDILAQCAERFDAFLFTGGPDVGPMVGAAASATGRSEVLSPERDRMESILLPAVMAWDKPILGICRGIQFINAALRGTLWQDLPSQHPSDIEHHMNPPYDAFGHNVSLVPGTPLASLFAGQTEMR